MHEQHELVRGQVERIAASSEFARAERMVSFLRFVVEKTLAGDYSALRERQIGIEVFDRPQDWDPKLDNIVRSEARRLRTKLQTYADSRSPDEAVRITMPKGGYAVQFTHPEHLNATAPEVLYTGSRAAIPARNYRWTAGLAFLALIISAVVWGFTFRLKTTVHASREAFEILPFSTEAGEQFSPSISPDGTQIAFIWDGGEKHEGIYIKSVKGGSPQQLTAGEVPDAHPSWSPDGKNIVFLRRFPTETHLVLKEIATGKERILQRKQDPMSNSSFWSLWSSANPLAGCQNIAWSPHGDAMTLTGSPGAHTGPGLVTISIKTGEEKIVTSPPGEDQDCYARIDPDGKQIAFIRTISHGVGFLYVVGIDGRNLKQLTLDGRDLRGLDWSADGKQIIFASKQHGGAYELRSIAKDGGESTPLPSDTASASDPTVSRAGGFMAFVESEENWNVWRVPIVDGHLGKPVRFLASSGQNHSPSYSPNGKIVAFVSDRSGSPEIWFSDNGGGNLHQMTHFGGPWLGTIRWSPDSANIIFDARPSGHSAIYTMHADGGSPTLVQQENFEARRPSWSRDGRFIYFDSTRGGRPEVWKRPLSGGDARVVAPPGTFAAIESLDGTNLVYSDVDFHALWVADLDGSNPRRVSEVRPDPDMDWAPAPGGVYFATSTASGFRVTEYNRSTQRLQEMGSVEQRLSLGTPSFALSPDGKWLLYATTDHRRSDIKLRRTTTEHD
jgi:Tol biopolymer transport system component